MSETGDLQCAEGSSLQVTDLGSTNGTYVGDDELATNQAVMVPLGTTIVFGALLCVMPHTRHAAPAWHTPIMNGLCWAQGMQAWQLSR